MANKDYNDKYNGYEKGDAMKKKKKKKKGPKKGH